MKDNQLEEDLITDDQKLRSTTRAQFLSFLIVVFSIILIGRAVYLETKKHNYYLETANSQYVNKTFISFDRGSILFSNHNDKSVPVAELAVKYHIGITPKLVKDATSLYETFASRIKLDKASFLEKVNKKEDPYEEIAKDVKEEDAMYFDSLNIKGLSLTKDNKRFYPQNDVGSKVIGFVGNNGVTVRGQYGIERYYDDVLSRGTIGQQVNFFAEIFADINKTEISNTDKREGDIVLTMDAEAERVLHQTLIETKKQWNSDTVGGIIMDPSTGAIIAMDALPSFDPNDFSSVKDPSVFGNQLVSGVYEMGSIMKPITMASALDAGAITASTTYTDTGCRELATYNVCNFDKKARGPHTAVHTILDESLNVGIVFLVEQLGMKNFDTYFKKFGIGQETGIDLPSEASGLTNNLDSNVFVDSATAGFGQGIAITPIQTIRALAVLGNGGKLINPYVVDRIVYKDGEIKKMIPNDGTQVIKQETSEEITRMLVHVVDTALLHGADKMDHYSIAAKTGTAQEPQPGGGYYSDRFLHSFFGYFPAYNPKFIIFLFHTNPKGAPYASATLSEPFFKLVKFLISYYEVPPDR